MTSTDLVDKAERLYADSIVWDMVWPLEPYCGNDFSALTRFKDCGYTLISLTVAGDNHNISEAAQRVAAIRRQVLDNADAYVLVETVADVQRAKAEDKLAIALHFEGTRCFERNLDMIEAFYQLGVRHTLIAFNNSNSAGGGCAEAVDGGLTAYGRLLVAELERVGMLLDLSHTGEKTSLDALEMATRPTVFTHSNAARLTPHYRNLTDEQISACAKTGGLVGISGSSGYLGDLDTKIETVFKHMDYMVQLVGPKHVGLGLDIVFNADELNKWIRTRPEEWPGTSDPDWPGFRYVQPEQVSGLCELMLRAGYADGDVVNILGGNYMRICADVWE